MRAWNIRRKALRMGEVQGQGYIGQAFGVADVLATSYFHALEYRPEDPEWEGRDRFLLSIGHYAIALYAALMEAGILPEDEIDTYGMDDSRMPMSGMASYTPGMEITGGSLGQGLGIAVGMALGLKRKKNPAYVYNLMSDGELGEGSTWEAVMSATQWKLDNLICIVDFNNQQADGPSRDALAVGAEAPKWQAFGWHAQEVDGNDLSALTAAFDVARSLNDAKPRVIICHTKMCKGVDFLEARESNHFIRVEADEWAKALAVLEEGKPL
ncbi:putative transketolase alpha subunit protein [Roseovarius sp. 217]|nr:putative transketolase alpha subunit protein [Roseovarius sp. 217]